MFVWLLWNKKNQKLSEELEANPNKQKTTTTKKKKRAELIDRQDRKHRQQTGE